MGLSATKRHNLNFKRFFCSIDPALELNSKKKESFHGSHEKLKLILIIFNSETLINCCTKDYFHRSLAYFMFHCMLEMQLCVSLFRV